MKTENPPKIGDREKAWYYQEPCFDQYVYVHERKIDLAATDDAITVRYQCRYL